MWGFTLRGQESFGGRQPARLTSALVVTVCMSVWAQGETQGAGVVQLYLVFMGRKLTLQSVRRPAIGIVSIVCTLSMDGDSMLSCGM